MHADFHELSEFAAGRREAEGHIAACSACRAELARLRAVTGGLRALPPLAPPVGGWSAARSRASGRDPAPSATPAAGVLAASLLVVLAAAVLSGGQPVPAVLPAAGPQLAPPLDGLVAENTRLEAYLARLPQPGRTRVGTAYTVAALEDRLAVVDDRITTVSLEPHAPELAEELWRERVTLMDSLVRVRYANAVASR
jgi:hypothetical protein